MRLSSALLSSYRYLCVVAQGPVVRNCGNLAKGDEAKSEALDSSCYRSDLRSSTMWAVNI